MTFKEAYYYFFYKFYKFGLDSPLFSRDFSAVVLIAMFETILFITIKFYYIEFINSNDVFRLDSFQTIFFGLAIFLLNYFSFIKGSKWKKYNEQFDRWPKRKNVVGSLIVLGIVIIIFVNMEISFNLMAKIAAARRH